MVFDLSIVVLALNEARKCLARSSFVRVRDTSSEHGSTPQCFLHDFTAACSTVP
jgi:hypothetical protein